MTSNGQTTWIAPRGIVWALLIALSLATVFALIGTSRSAFNYGTESDFIGGYIPEARRLLNGEPLAIAFHPPFYVMNLSLAYWLTGDWLDAGVLLAAISSLGAMAGAFVLMHELSGPHGGITGVVALAVSPTFAFYAMQATSDVFSLCLHLLTFALILLSARRTTPLLSIWAGIALGSALLTRTNNLALLALIGFYFVPYRESVSRPQSSRQRRPLVLFSAGLALPLLAWLAFATSTGAPFAPTHNHENLALTYFSDGDRISGDARMALAKEFSSTGEVLMRDPQRVARIYVRDFKATVSRLLSKNSGLAPFPLFLVAAVCVPFIAIRDRVRRPAILLTAASIAIMLGLLNFKAYEPRYYIFLVPFAGAAVFHAIRIASQDFWSSRLRRGLLIGAATAFTVLGTAHAVSNGKALLHASLSADASAAARHFPASAAEPGRVVLARKPHLAHYTESIDGFFPDCPSLTELREALLGIASRHNGPIYLLYGSAERWARPALKALDDPLAARDAGLAPVAHGAECGGWHLYLVLRDAPAR